MVYTSEHITRLRGRYSVSCVERCIRNISTIAVVRKNFVGEWPYRTGRADKTWMIYMYIDDYASTTRVFMTIGFDLTDMTVPSANKALQGGHLE